MNGERPFIEVSNLKKYFPVRRSLGDIIHRRPPLQVKAVDGLNFDIKKAEIFGLAGESGCGKTTTGRMLVGLIEPTDGKILCDGVNILELNRKDLKSYRRKLQIIFQDPYESLNPRMTVYDILSEPIKIHNLAETRDEEEKMVIVAMENVEIYPPEEFFFRYPHELSGGQRQRVAVARALVLNPQFIVADEPVSMLDVSIRAEVLNLMSSLRESLGISILFITHELAVTRHMCDRIAIMYLGKIVEIGSTEDVIFNPLHPYTVALELAVPTPDPTAERTKVVIKGEVPTPINPPSGCRFHPRCHEVMAICSKQEPPLIEVGKGHLVACHKYPA